MPVRPDLVECWVFRMRADGRPEFLLIQRADDRIFPGIWQPVTGGLQPAEAAPAGALREVLEETGLRAPAIEAFYDLDQVGSFYDETLEAIVTSVIFAVRVGPDAEPTLSSEHVDHAWVDGDEAVARSVWPPYRESLRLIGQLTTDPAMARWFELDSGGRRVARPPR
ncbi:MAG TPA: NUDIX domain-containing protein [Vitreimonas sp.]|nr:NUDIX domain-containing protein [Vitreimonas sp.]